MQRLSTFTCFAALALGQFVVASPVQGAEPTRVASAFDKDNPFDIHLGLAYSYEFTRSAILREWNSGLREDQDTQLVKDLIYRHQRHVLTPSLEIGLWHDLALYAQLPVILADYRDYGFDQRSDNCVFGNSPNAICVNKANSTTIRDQIVPGSGFDGRSTVSPFSQFTGAGTERIFNGPVRRGIDQLWVGLKYGIFSQARRQHLPTWVIGAEGRFGIGRPMTFSRSVVPDEPAGNHRVGRRIHELGLWTAVSRRFSRLEPYMSAYWRQALRASGSQFQDFSDLGAQTRTNPQSTAGITLGTEIIPYENKTKAIKVAVVLQTQAALLYGGRAYSEIWELLADSPALVGSSDPTKAGQCDRDSALAFAARNPGDPSYVAMGGPSCARFNGITDVQNYGTFGVNLALNLNLGPYVRLFAGTNLQTATRHFLTFTERGRPDGGTDDQRVEAGTAEVNPLRRDVIDNVGRRYATDDVLNLQAYLRLLLTF